MNGEDKFLAKPSGSCCLVGNIHEGEPKGKVETIAGIETYISSPSSNKANGHILLYFPDVWGFFTNGFLVMDGFADAGYLVLGLDYFRGVRCVSSINQISLLNVAGSSLEAQKEPA